MSSIYKEAGVDLETYARFIEMLKERCRKAWPTGREIGFFAGEGSIPSSLRTNNLKLKVSTDGVGTAAIVAGLMGSFEVLGRNAVVNTLLDVYVDGGTTAYVLSTLKVARLQPDLHITAIEGIIQGCLSAGCRLIGGKTAELPNTYRHDWQIDLDIHAIGFSRNTGPGFPLRSGQEIYGWPCPNPGLNEFSLIRHIFKIGKDDDEGFTASYKSLRGFKEELGDPLWKVLLAPTPLWIPEIEEQCDEGVVFAGPPSHAHITGGGMPGNIPRILPTDLKAVIDRSSWPRPPIFRLIEELGHIPQADMDIVFNNGIKIVSFVDTEAGVRPTDPNVHLIGRIEQRRDDEPQVQLVGKYNDK